MGYSSEAYNQIYELHKQNNRNLDYLGWLSLYENSSKNFVKEIYYRDQIEKYDPWNLKNCLLLGQAYKQVGDLEGAAKMRNKIIYVAPDSDIAATAARDLA